MDGQEGHFRFIIALQFLQASSLLSTDRCETVQLLLIDQNLLSGSPAFNCRDLFSAGTYDDNSIDLVTNSTAALLVSAKPMGGRTKRILTKFVAHLAYLQLILASSFSFVPPKSEDNENTCSQTMVCVTLLLLFERWWGFSVPLMVLLFDARQRSRINEAPHGPMSHSRTMRRGRNIQRWDKVLVQSWQNRVSGFLCRYLTSSSLLSRFTSNNAHWPWSKKEHSAKFKSAHQNSTDDEEYMATMIL